MIFLKIFFLFLVVLWCPSLVYGVLHGQKIHAANIVIWVIGLTGFITCEWLI